MSQRSKVLLKLSQLVMAHQQELAELETAEHGSPIRKTMNFDIPLCADFFEYFAGVARAMTGETLPVGPWAVSMTVKEPLGVVGLITPGTSRPSWSPGSWARPWSPATPAS